ncbi:hypothetical protein ACFFRR_002414 [Megaselia abdita]
MKYQTTSVNRPAKYNKSNVSLVDVSIVRDDFENSEEFSEVKCTLTDNFVNGEVDYINRLMNFEVRSDDVWVISMPKSGQEIISELAWLAQNNFDLEAATSSSNSIRVPYVELKALIGFTSDSFAYTDSLKSPRTVKTHLPIQFLPADLFVKKPKIIYIYRDICEVVLAYYYHCCAIGCFTGTKEDFVECFMKDDAPYLPYWNNVTNFWRRRGNQHIHYVSYSKVKKSLEAVLKEVCEFLGKPIPSQEVIGQIKEHLEVYDEVSELKKQIKTNEELKSITEKELDIDFKLSEESTRKLKDWSARFLSENGFSAEDFL